MWLFNFFLVERTLNQELQGKETCGKEIKGKLTIMPSSTSRMSCDSSLSLLFPSISSSSSSSFFSSSSSSCSFSFRRFGRPPGPPSYPAETGKTSTRMSAYRPGLLLLPGSKIMTGSKLFMSSKILTGLIVITRLWWSDCLHSDKTWRAEIRTEEELKN